MNFRDTIGHAKEAAATAAVSAAKSLMAYIKQLVTEGIARDIVIGNVHTDVDAILADTLVIWDTTVAGASVADGSLASFIACGGTGLGTRLPASKSLYDAVSGGIDAANRVAGKLQMITTTESLNVGAGTTDLFTGTTQAVVLEKLNLKMPTGDALAALVSVSIQTDDATPGVIVSAANGAYTNLTSETDISWTGSLLINVDTKIRLTAGGANGAACVATIVAQYRAVVNGGYLAVTP